ncbi:erythromycin esterase family protein [Bacillus tamaricis]|uniref:Erythromycin esterase family protein n=1 Tax=Evansella tamaricis TaxID=2069301 RepID=A0ABS6JGQ8_9BACI|nr:erythromycin esterase family protein [Evansella tamaricis]
MTKTEKVIDDIKKHSTTFGNTEELFPLIKEMKNAKYVLLGEASHGTSEFYTIRREITKKLIQEHGFSFVAVEGDWPACFEINRYIKGFNTETKITTKDILKRSFNRWPTWMWANQEMSDLVEWLASYNASKGRKSVGFYGLDVYSLWESMDAILHYLGKIKSPYMDKAKKAMECFEPYHRTADKYAISAAFYGEDCMDEVQDLLKSIHKNHAVYEDDLESSLSLRINAIATSNAENFYHTMVTSDSESWNIRDRHMAEVLHHIGKFYGPEAKGIIWEHNTHIGDARATDMASEGMVNVGQLTREQYGLENIFSVGLGTHHGTVIAADKWGSHAEVMTVPKAPEGTWENVLHQAGASNKYILFNKENRHLFRDIIGHRAIGVVYHPKYEHRGNYVPSRISERYDAFIHVDETKALKPL